MNQTIRVMKARRALKQAMADAKAVPMTTENVNSGAKCAALDRVLEAMAAVDAALYGSRRAAVFAKNAVTA